MIRSLVRVTVAGLCLLSLAACIGTLWLWWHSWHGGRERVGFHRSGDRFTIRFECGRATLFGPPPRWTPVTRQEKRVDVIVRQLRNDDCRWVTGVVASPDGARPTPALDAVASAALRLNLGITPELANIFIHMRVDSPAAAQAALLVALDDPARCLAAHVALTDEWGYDGDERLMPHLEPGHSWYIQLGMPAGSVPAGGTGTGTSRSPPDGRQRAMLYDYWRDRFAVPVRSWPIWPLAAAATLPPLLWCCAKGRARQERRRRLRLKLCLACGYDLRHSPERCPECGAAAGRARPP